MHVPTHAHLRRRPASSPRFGQIAGMWQRLLWLTAVAICAPLLRAHDPGISTAQGDLRGGELILTTGFAPADIQQLLPASDRRDGSWTQGEFSALEQRLNAIAPQLWELRVGDVVVPPREIRVELLPGDSVSFRLVFPLRVTAEKVTLRALKLAELPSGHRQFVIVSDEHGFTVTKKLLSARDPVLEFTLPPAGGNSLPSANESRTADESEPPAFWGFVRLGIEHIWTGYDHLLFLFALLIVCRSFRSIVAIISCFTLAHSITLALATLDVVNLPSRYVEPAIAASIVFVGAENLWRRGEEPRGRWALTFAFGLIHGFGFASVLRDLGVGGSAGGVAMPLFTFNAGVEIGQIAVAAIVLPIVWQLRKREAFVRRGVPVLSAIVALAGLCWFLKRTGLA